MAQMAVPSAEQAAMQLQARITASSAAVAWVVAPRKTGRRCWSCCCCCCCSNSPSCGRELAPAVSERFWREGEGPVRGQCCWQRWELQRPLQALQQSRQSGVVEWCWVLHPPSVQALRALQRSGHPQAVESGLLLHSPSAARWQRWKLLRALQALHRPRQSWVVESCLLLHPPSAQSLQSLQVGHPQAVESYLLLQPPSAARRFPRATEDPSRRRRRASSGASGASGASGS